MSRQPTSWSHEADAFSDGSDSESSGSYDSTSTELDTRYEENTDETESTDTGEMGYITKDDEFYQEQTYHQTASVPDTRRGFLRRNAPHAAKNEENARIRSFLVWSLVNILPIIVGLWLLRGFLSLSPSPSSSPEVPGSKSTGLLPPPLYPRGDFGPYTQRENRGSKTLKARTPWNSRTFEWSALGELMEPYEKLVDMDIVGLPISKGIHIARDEVREFWRAIEKFSWYPSIREEMEAYEKAFNEALANRDTFTSAVNRMITKTLHHNRVVNKTPTEGGGTNHDCCGLTVSLSLQLMEPHLPIAAGKHYLTSLEHLHEPYRRLESKFKEQFEGSPPKGLQNHFINLAGFNNFASETLTLDAMERLEALKDARDRLEWILLNMRLAREGLNCSQVLDHYLRANMACEQIRRKIQMIGR